MTMLAKILLGAGWQLVHAVSGSRYSRGMYITQGVDHINEFVVPILFQVSHVYSPNIMTLVL